MADDETPATTPEEPPEARPRPRPPLAVVVKGWPRLSETFIAQELAMLEARGFRFEIWSLRDPTPGPRHNLHDQIKAPVRYLPEYLHAAPLRVIACFFHAMGQPGFSRAFRFWLRDLRRDLSRNRIRRFGQACVLATEAPPALRAFYVHFLHTPGSVARYAATMLELPWGFSAHARDIWTIPDWEKAEKIADSAFGVTCTAAGHRHLTSLTRDKKRVALQYHGLELSRFPAPPAPRVRRDGGDAADPLRIVSVGRMVEKKGYDVLIEALADLPAAMQWRMAHIGGGPLLKNLQKQARDAGVARNIAFRGPAPMGEVIRSLRWGDIFVLPSRVASDGDRDGLPNVLMEAASQNCPIISTRAGAIEEFVTDGVTGLLVKPNNPHALSDALQRMARNPVERGRMASSSADSRIWGSCPGRPWPTARTRTGRARPSGLPSSNG